MNNIALILNIGPVTDAQAEIKTLACKRWAKLCPTQILVPFFGEKGVRELTEAFGFTLVPCSSQIKIDNKPYPLFSNIFEECNKHLLPQIEHIIYTNGDIIPITPPKDIIRIVESCDQLSKGDYIGLIHRYNFAGTTIPDHNILSNLIDSQPINYPGVDSFVCSRVIFERLTYTIPPLIMTTYGADRWLLDWSFHCVDMTFFLEQSIKTAHIAHPRRKEADMSSKDFMTSKDPLIEYNRQHINISLDEIFDRMHIRSLHLTNGVTLNEVYRKW